MIYLSCDVHIEDFHGQKVRKNDRMPDPVTVSVHGEWEFQYEYPIAGTVAIKRQLSAPTSDEIVLHAANDYRRLYAEEVGQPIDPASPKAVLIENVLSKTHELCFGPRTTPYGIWGHRLCDLVLEEIVIDPGTRTIKFNVGS